MTAQSVRSSGWRRPQPAEGSESRRRGEIYKALHTLVLPKKKASHARRMGRSTHRAEKQVILAKHRSSHEALGTTDRLARPADHLRVLLRVRRRTPSPVRAQGSRCKDQSAAHRGWALRLALHAAHRPRLASQASVQRQSPSTALRWGAMQQTCTHAGLLNFALHDCSVGGGARRRHSPLALGSALGRRRPGAAGRPGTRRAARRGSGGCTGSRGPGLAAAREGAGRGARQRRGRTPAACRARARGGGVGGWVGGGSRGHCGEGSHARAAPRHPGHPAAWAEGRPKRPASVASDASDSASVASVRLEQNALVAAAAAGPLHAVPLDTPAGRRRVAARGSGFVVFSKSREALADYRQGATRRGHPVEEDMRTMALSPAAPCKSSGLQQRRNPLRGGGGPRAATLGLEALPSAHHRQLDHVRRRALPRPPTPPPHPPTHRLTQARRPTSPHTRRPHEAAVSARPYPHPGLGPAG